MKPFSYSRWAMDMVRDAPNPSLREASCCSVVVRKGAYGWRRYGLDSTDCTVKVVSRSASVSACACARSRWTGPVPDAALSSPVLVKSDPRATLAPSTECSLAVKIRTSWSGPASKLPSMSQYEATRKAIRSRSRSTTRRVATDWTRPADSPLITFFHSTGEIS